MVDLHWFPKQYNVGVQRCKQLRSCSICYNVFFICSTSSNTSFLRLYFKPIVGSNRCMTWKNVFKQKISWTWSWWKRNSMMGVNVSNQVFLTSKKWHSRSQKWFYFKNLSLTFAVDILVWIFLGKLPHKSTGKLLEHRGLEHKFLRGLRLEHF